MFKSKKINFLALLVLSLYFFSCQGANDLSLLPHSFSPTSYFHVYYEFTPAGSITFAIQFNKPNQYFSIGVGSSMSGADIWAFNIVGGKVVALDYHGIGDTTPVLDTANGGKNNLNVIGQKVTSTGSFVKFTRLLNTGDTKNDKVIAPGLTSFIWATEPGSPTLSFHGPNFGVLRVNLVTDSTAVAGQGAQGEEQLTGYEEEANLSEEGNVGENAENGEVSEMTEMTEMEALEVGEGLTLLF